MLENCHVNSASYGKTKFISKIGIQFSDFGLYETQNWKNVVQKFQI